MFAENRKISLRQLQILLLLDSFGSAVLFLPAELAQIGGKGCWILALIGGGVFVLVAYLMAYTGSRMPEGTIVLWCRRCFGYLWGSVILAGLAVKLLFDGMLELKVFSEVVCRSMLPDTPVWALSLVILTIAGLLAMQGAECRGRTAEVLFFVVAVPLVIILVAVSISAEYGRIRPVELPSFSAMGNGILAMSLVFQGLPFLYFVYPEIRKTNRIPLAAVISSTITVGVITVIAFLCLAVYGEGILSEKLLPALQMMERVSFTGLFLTRQDILLLWFWMASVCIFLSGILFYGSLLGIRLFRKKESERKKWLLGWMAVIFAASFLPQELSEAYEWRLQISPWLNLLFLVVLPVILLIFGKGEKMDA